MESNPKKNYIYNLIYQVLLLIIPLVTAPYLSRVLGANGIGIYSYNYAIVYYFMLLTLLGVNNYGNRTIAKNRDDKEQLSRTFWGIFILQLIMGFIMTLLYLLYILLFDIAYEKVAIVQILFIISAILDINWFFLGIEEFKKTITRNSLVKIATILLIFIFIKSESDLTKYTFIMASMTCLSQLFLWLFIRKKIVFVKLKKNDITKHIKPNIVLFIPVIAVSLYKMMDKIMLGSLANTQEVGFYENAEKIANLPLIFITALGTVMLPRMSNIVKQRDDKKMIEYIDKSIIFVMFISFAMAFGLMAIGNDFAPLFFGSEFQKSGILIVLLATTLPFLSFANVLRTQYLIPQEKDKIYILSVSIGAIVNLIMNLIFIPDLGSIGACIGTISAEFIVMFTQTLFLRRELNVKKYILSSVPFLFNSCIMFVVVYILRYIVSNIAIRVVFQILFGGIIYLLLNYKYLLSILNGRKLLHIIQKNE